MYYIITYLKMHIYLTHASQTLKKKNKQQSNNKKNPSQTNRVSLWIRGFPLRIFAYQWMTQHILFCITTTAKTNKKNQPLIQLLTVSLVVHYLVKNWKSNGKNIGDVQLYQLVALNPTQVPSFPCPQPPPPLPKKNNNNNPKDL